MNMQKVTDISFGKYGKVLEGYEITRILKEMEHTPLVEAFFVPAGTVVEMYATTLHYAPCTAAEGGFRCVVILPAGTNTEINFPLSGNGEDKLMTAKNKWLIAHPDAGIEGAFCGLIDENITI